MGRKDAALLVFLGRMFGIAPGILRMDAKKDSQSH